jgi:hypothetical protein
VAAGAADRERARSLNEAVRGRPTAGPGAADTGDAGALRRSFADGPDEAGEPEEAREAEEDHAKEGEAIIEAAQVSLPSEREVCVTRELRTPRDLVDEAYTVPSLVRRGLLLRGPAGGSMPVCEMDVRVGGQLRCVLRSDEDGTQLGARPPTQVMVNFIDAHRDAYGVEPIRTACGSQT